MTREEVKEEILNIPNKNIVVELPTSFGKTRMAIDRLKTIDKKDKILIVIPRLVLIENWKEEFIKWNEKDLLNNITFTTYVSMPKHINKWDVVIFDECQHLSARCQEALSKYIVSNSIFLSATIKNELKSELKTIISDIYFYKVSMKEAIEEEILPDPKVFLLPMKLINEFPTETIIKNPNGKGNIESSWATRWQYLKQKQYKVTIKCTQKQYLDDLNSQIEYWKTRYMRSRNEIFRNKWLKLSGDRLKWLSDKKNYMVRVILQLLSNERTLTFCNSINQTEELGKYCINSKNKESDKILQDFNEGKIKHITSCNMLNEGINLTNCRVGIYANLNSSDIIIKQRLGRILRHKHPVIIIPYYKNTREEELVQKMLEDYNPELIKIVNNPYEIII